MRLFLILQVQFSMKTTALMGNLFKCNINKYFLWTYTTQSTNLPISNKYPQDSLRRNKIFWPVVNSCGLKMKMYIHVSHQVRKLTSMSLWTVLLVLGTLTNNTKKKKETTIILLRNTNSHIRVIKLSSSSNSSKSHSKGISPHPIVLMRKTLSPRYVCFTQFTW